MASQKAKQIDFLSAGLSDSSGQPYRGGKVYFWPSSSKTTPKEVYSTINKSQVLSQPVILGNSGEATIFGEGVYYIEAYDKNDVLIQTWDGYNYSSTVDFGGLYIDVGAEYGTTGAAIQTAIDALNSNNNYSFLFQNSDFVISQNIIFPDNVVCHLWPTARFTITASKDVKFEIDYVASSGFEFFFGSGTVSFGPKVTKSDDTLYWGGSHKTGVVSHKNSRVNIWSSSDTSTTQDEERVLRIDATSGNKTVPLLTAVGQQGVFYTVIKTDSSTNTVTIDPDGTQIINGVSTYVLYKQFDSVTFLCTGTGWEIISVHRDTIQSTPSGGISFSGKRFEQVQKDITQNATPTNIFKIDSWSSGYHTVLMTVTSTLNGPANDSLKTIYSLNMYSALASLKGTDHLISSANTPTNAISISGGTVTFSCQPNNIPDEQAVCSFEVEIEGRFQYSLVLEEL